MWKCIKLLLVLDVVSYEIYITSKTSNNARTEGSQKWCHLPQFFYFRVTHITTHVSSGLQLMQLLNYDWRLTEPSDDSQIIFLVTI